MAEGLGDLVAVEREHPPRRLLEGDRQQVVVLGQPLAGAQVERHALPAPVVDEGLDGDEGLGVGVGGDALLLAVAGVLAADDVLGRAAATSSRRPSRARAPSGFGVQRGRRLHRDEAEHLEEVGDDHVAEGAGFLVEAAAHLDRERLRDVDLDVVDVVAVPDRLEHPVGEAQRQQVLHRLAAEVVVDPVDVALARRPSAGRRSARRAEARSVPKGFSVITRAPSPSPSSPICSTVAGGGVRRQREVEEERRRRRRGPRARRSIASPSGSKPSPTRGEAQRLGEPLPGLRRRAVCDPSPRPTRGPARGTPRRSIALRAAPMMRKRSGIRPTRARWNIPGSSLRLARSPVAPKRTITWSSGTWAPAALAVALAVVTLTPPG